MDKLLVTTTERPDLVPLVAGWLWEAFWREEGSSLAHTTALVAQPQALLGPPRTFVLLAEGVPVGTASLIAHDLEGRPDLTPWLAGVFVIPAARGRGHVRDLVTAVEGACREAGIPLLWLYTATAGRIYERLGWTLVEDFTHLGKPTALMRRDL